MFPAHAGVILDVSGKTQKEIGAPRTRGGGSQVDLEQCTFKGALPAHAGVIL